MVAVRRVVHVLLWVLALPFVAVLALRAFVGNVYYVDSGSMEPVLHGSATDGEFVFVRYDDAPKPQRAELVVLVRPGEQDPVVKRVAGLGGESVQVVAGDLFVDGKVLAPEEPRAPLVPLVDSARDDLGKLFAFDPPAWRLAAGVWRLDASGPQTVLAGFKQRLLNSYPGPSGRLVEGLFPVNDAVLEVEVRVEEPWKRIVTALTEEADRFELELAAAGAGSAHLRLARWVGQGGVGETLAEADVPFAAGAWHRVRFANVDNELRVGLDALGAVLRHAYAVNNVSPKTRESNYVHRLPRAELGGQEVRAEFRAVRIWRDVAYFELGTVGTSSPETLAPNKIFVLGDNSADSVDSRQWGPVPAASIVGHPAWVVWPPSRWRRLR